MTQAMEPASSLADLSRRLKRKDTVFAAWIGQSAPSFPEVLLQVGFDAAIFDMQHGMLDFADAVQCIATTALWKRSAIVRIPVDDFATASRLLDAGASAIIAPMMESAADAARFVGFCKYPPLGRRSFGPQRALNLSGLSYTEYLQQANAMQLAIGMVETEQALQSLDEILAVPGLDGVFVGPADLSVSLSGGQRMDPLAPEVFEALDLVAAKAAAHGKFASAFCMSGKHAAQVAAKGFQLCSVGTDSQFLREAAASHLAAAKGPM